MKYPKKFSKYSELLSWYCFFAGHKWKSSWRRKSNFEELSSREPTYLERHDSSGNYLYEYGAYWKYKCVRCRLKTTEYAYQPWYKKIWFGLKYGFWMNIKTDTSQLSRNKIYKKILWMPIFIFISFIRGQVLYSDHIPMSFLGRIDDCWWYILSNMELKDE